MQKGTNDTNPNTSKRPLYPFDVVTLQQTLLPHNPCFIGLFYDKRSNTFTDEDGLVVYCMQEFVTPNDLFLFREHKKDMIFRHRTWPGVYCALYYPNDLPYDVYNYIVDPVTDLIDFEIDQYFERR